MSTSLFPCGELGYFPILWMHIGLVPKMCSHKTTLPLAQSRTLSSGVEICSKVDQDLLHPNTSLRGFIIFPTQKLQWKGLFE